MKWGLLGFKFLVYLRDLKTPMFALKKLLYPKLTSYKNLSLRPSFLKKWNPMCNWYLDNITEVECYWCHVAPLLKLGINWREWDTEIWWEPYGQIWLLHTWNQVKPQNLWSSSPLDFPFLPENLFLTEGTHYSSSETAVYTAPWSSSNPTSLLLLLDSGFTHEEVLKKKIQSIS